MFIVLYPSSHLAFNDNVDLCSYKENEKSWAALGEQIDRRFILKNNAANETKVEFNAKDFLLMF